MQLMVVDFICRVQFAVPMNCDVAKLQVQFASEPWLENEDNLPLEEAVWIGFDNEDKEYCRTVDTDDIGVTIEV